ncbi:ECs_2282 family putative zinc-binding protein [Klebsiella variicola]|uniref:ECs_2282 family putative zinc-binding protein n=1 Tax=Klebsiella variicola TaxID=244366 RepID=UPI0040450C8A
MSFISCSLVLLCKPISIKITRPECGSEHIKAPAEVHTLDDLAGSICADCGREISKDDVVSQARQLAIDSLRDSIGKS